jgi:hypothetical protein
MRTILAVFYLYVVLFNWCCAPKLSSSNNISQGISGYVKEVRGNQMPSPDIARAAPKGIETTIYVYELTNLSQVQGTAPFYKTIGTKFIQSITSDSLGHFAAELPAGSYSLFTKLDEQFYANSFDEKNNIAAVTVEENKVSEVNITISAKASY